MGRPLVLEPERDVGGVPGVVGDLLDLEQGTVGEDPLLDRAVVDDIARRRLDETPVPGPVAEPIGNLKPLAAPEVASSSNCGQRAWCDGLAAG